MKLRAIMAEGMKLGVYPKGISMSSPGLPVLPDTLTLARWPHIGPPVEMNVFFFLCSQATMSFRLP